MKNKEHLNKEEYQKTKKKSNLLVNLLIIIIFLGVISSGILLIGKGTEDLKSLNNKNEISDNQTEKPNKTLEDLEKELATAKESINNKKAELEIAIDNKQIECDKFRQTETTEFFKNSNSDAFYAAERNTENCEKEISSMEQQVRDLEYDTSWSDNDEVNSLISNKQDIEDRIDDIKNPKMFFPIFTQKEFDWDKFWAFVEIIFGGLIVIVPILCVIAVYNRIIKSTTKVNNTFANIDVYLKKRWDLIPNILESVKGYSAHESKTLTNITKLRQDNNYSNMNINDKVVLNNELSKNISKILLLQENYPDLKANSNYLDLSNQLSSIENEISLSRIKYNDAVMNYNNTIQVFPNNLLAHFLGNKEMNMFSISAEEKENVEVKL